MMKNNRIRGIIFSVCVCLVAIYLIKTIVSNEKASNANANLSDDFVEFLDVGQGDCAIISSNGYNCLIDTGASTSEKSIMKKLAEKKIKNIDVISISHFHADHTGCLYEIVKDFSVSNLLFPIQLESTDIPNNVTYAKNECIAEDGDLVIAKKGQTIHLGDFKLSVLFRNVSSNDENNRSVYIMAKIGETKFFFTGDGEKETEHLLLNQGLNLDCDVLKVPHHGGSTSSSEEFIEECSPEYAIISCGEDNMYGHPHKETIDRLNKRKIKTYRTDEDGSILFRVCEDNVLISTDK